MDDGTFRFRYHGCSQSNGHVRGKWELTNNTVLISPYIPDELLDSKYIIKGDSLISENLQNNSFIVCALYESPDVIIE